MPERVGMALPRFAPLALAVLVAVPLSAQSDQLNQKKLQILLIGGANNHDFDFTHKELRSILEETGRFEVTITRDPKTSLVGDLSSYDAFVCDYNGPRWGEDAQVAFTSAIRKGMGVAFIHAANNPFEGWADYEAMVGLLWRKGAGHGRFHPYDVDIVVEDHPITRGMRKLVMHPDELYHRLSNPQSAEFTVLMDSLSSKKSGGTGNREPQVLVNQFGAGRVFHTTLGHVWRNVPQTRVSQRDPQFRRLVARGVEWAASGRVTLSPEPMNWVTPEEKSQGFERIFDGRTTDGWVFPEMANAWKVDHAALHGTKASQELQVDGAVGDFELRFSWATTKGGKNGALARVNYRPGDRIDAALELDATSGVFRDAAVKVANGRVEHWLDGKRVTAYTLPKGEGTAPFRFSVERGAVHLRDLRLRRIP